MTSNPYAPPRAVSADPVDEPAPTFVDRASKPVSAWLLQLLCAVCIVSVLYGVGLLAARLADSSRVNWVPAILGIVVYVALLAWFGFAFMGAQRRTASGRWLGVSVLAALLLLCVVSGARILAEGGHRDRDVAYQTGQVFGIGFWLLVTGWWLHAFGFSAKARKWFRVDVASTGRARGPWAP